MAKYAQKIDFSKTGDLDVKKEDGTDDSKSDSDSKDAFQSSLWPWDSVRNKLRNTLQEVCVLADVLAIAKDKRCVFLVMFVSFVNFYVVCFVFICAKYT